MKIIARPPKQGKTTHLVNMAADNNGYIVVHTKSRAREVRQLAERLGVSINFPLTFNEFLDGAFHKTRCAPLFIDEVGMLLQHIAKGTTIGAISLTIGEE